MCNIFLFIAIGCGLEQGTYTYEDGSEYVGELKYGLPNGQGTKSWSDGRKYFGEWKDGYADGQGTMIIPEHKIMDASGSIMPGMQPLPVIQRGSEYFGEWKEGKPHGQGTVTVTDGTVTKGRWEDGEFIGE